MCLTAPPIIPLSYFLIGEKAVLIWRINTYHDGEKYQVAGQNPLRLKPGELRKAVATRGLSPIGTNEELLTALMEFLKKQQPAEGGADSSDDDKPIASGNKRPRATGVDKVVIATEVLRLGELGEFVSILQLLGDPVNADSTVRNLHLQCDIHECFCCCVGRTDAESLPEDFDAHPSG